MRIKYFLILLFATLSNFASAQQIEIGSFGITGGTWNANNTLLLIKRDANTTFQTNLFVIRSTLPDIISRPIKLEARVIFINKLDQDWTIVSPVVNFTTTDFPGTTGASQNKTVSTTIPKDFLFSSADGELVIQWRYYKDGYPAPDQVNGWTSWYQTKQKINCRLEPVVVPPTTISGPTSICSEATYTITNPGTISLANANGIATLTALGNNQWKVTRNGQANGSIVLRSIDVNGQATDKNITIGAKIDGYIEGPSSMRPGLTYEFKLILNDNISNYSNIELWQPSGTTLVSQTATTITVKVLPNFAFSPGTNEQVVTVTANAQVGACGNASITLPVTVFDPRIPTGGIN